MEEKRKRLMFELADIEVESILSVSHKDRLHIVVYGIPGMNVMSNEELIDYAKSEYYEEQTRACRTHRGHDLANNRG